MMIIASIFCAWLVGTLCVSALWPAPHRGAERFLVLFLGLGVGLGVTSALFCLASVAADNPLWLVIGLELSISAAAGYRIWRMRSTPRDGVGATRSAAGDRVTSTGPRGFDVVAVLALTALFQASVIALVIAVRAYAAMPHSASDGWSIWNLHARILFRAQSAWPALLTAPQLAWSHPDYPLLVPASVARGWTYVGSDASFVGGTISILFGVATVGTLVGAVACRRSFAAACLGGLVLLGTPFFVTFAANQHADIPLGFFLLAAVATLTLRDSSRPSAGLQALAGALAGLAAWTKNEGLLFAVILGIGWTVVLLRRGSRREICGFLIGLGVGLLPVLIFKTAIAPANDILASRPLDRVQNLFDGSRHRLIVQSIWRDVRAFGEWRVAPLWLLALATIGPGWKRLKLEECTVAVVVGAMLGGCYLVYLLTDWDLASHLDSSLVRILVQLWPAALLFWCFVTFGPGTGTLPTRRPVRMRWIVTANIVLGAAIMFGMKQQLSANELARAGGPLRPIQAFLGNGWYSSERYAGERWAWSSGRGVLHLHSARDEAGHVLLRFTLASHGARDVTIRRAEEIIWRGHVASGERVAVALTLTALPAGETELVFDSPNPARREGPGDSGRALAFAIFNPRFE